MQIKSTYSSLDFIFVITLLLFLIGATIKPATDFFVGYPRYYSFLLTTISNLSVYFIITSFISSVFFVLAWSLSKVRFPMLGSPASLYLVIKFYAVLVYFSYDALDLKVFLSLVISLSIVSFISIYETKRGGAFYLVSLSVFLFSILFAITNILELYLNTNSVIWKGRFYGVTNHPNFVGGYSALMIPFVIWGWFEFKSVVKYLALVVGLILFSIIVFSGSRSSMLSCVFSLWCIGIIRFGFFKSIFSSLLLSILAIVALFLALSFSDFGFGFERLLSQENTRENIYGPLWNVFLSNWLFGNPLATGATSNSYLLILARLGIVGGIIFLILIFSVLIEIISMKGRNRLDDLSLPFLASFCVLLPYSAFEGVLLENLSFGQCIFLLSLAYIGLNQLILPKSLVTE